MKQLKHVAKFSCGPLVSYFDLFRVRGTTDAATAATEEAFIATQYVGPVSLRFLASHWVWLLDYQTYLQLIPCSIRKPMRQLVALSHRSTIWLGTNVCYPVKRNCMKHHETAVLPLLTSFSHHSHWSFKVFTKAHHQPSTTVFIQVGWVQDTIAPSTALDFFSNQAWNLEICWIYRYSGAKQRVCSSAFQHSGVEPGNYAEIHHVLCNWIGWFLGNLTKGYKGLPDAWSYFYPEFRRLACLIQQTKRMMNSWCASLAMEWVHYRRTIMKYHEPSPSARIAKAHGSEDVGSLPVFFGFFWIGWFDQTPQSQNFILKRDALNWWLWNRPCVPCCRYGDLSSWERIIQKQPEVSKNRKCDAFHRAKTCEDYIFGTLLSRRLASGMSAFDSSYPHVWFPKYTSFDVRLFGWSYGNLSRPARCEGKMLCQWLVQDLQLFDGSSPPW